MALSEQDILWSRTSRLPDVVVCLGTKIPDYELSAKECPCWLSDHRMKRDKKEAIKGAKEALLASQFYIELVGLPQVDHVGFHCRASVHCRMTPSSPAYHTLIQQLRKNRARFHYDYKSIPCVNKQLYDEAGRGIAFSRYIEFSVTSFSDEIDIKISGIIDGARSISNCPYKIQTLIQDQGLDCAFGHRDHNRRYFG